MQTTKIHRIEFKSVLKMLPGHIFMDKILSYCLKILWYNNVVLIILEGVETCASNLRFFQRLCFRCHLMYFFPMSWHQEASQNTQSTL